MRLAELMGHGGEHLGNRRDKAPFLVRRDAYYRYFDRGRQRFDAPEHGDKVGCPPGQTSFRVQHFPRDRVTLNI